MEKSLESLEEDEDGKQKVLEYVSILVVGVYFQFPCIFPIFLFPLNVYSFTFLVRSGEPLVSSEESSSTRPGLGWRALTVFKV
jgi:hypothetical protein